MKIVILGNGFDLGSGLPTSYNDYFFSFEKEKQDEFSKLRDFLVYKKSSDIVTEPFYLNVEFSERFEQRRTEINEHLIPVKDDLVKLLLESDISLWNILFWYLKYFDYQDIKEKNWSNVELEISSLINDYTKLTLLNRNDKINVIRSKIDDLFSTINHSSPNSSSSSSEEKYSKNIFYKLSKSDRLRIICDSIIINRYGTLFDSDYLTILRNELILFENSFQSYITTISQNMIILKQKNLGIYRNNFLKVSNNTSRDFFILNFNYTDFSSINRKDSFTMERDKSKINIRQMNVHGAYYSKIIFGIDQTDQFNENHFQFTKTYRKMELQNEVQQTKLPASEDIDEIIIYGHSLANADYSYFHSIFDFYDIYGSNIVLNFSFSFYGEEEYHANIKRRHVQNVMRLLKYYGEKMFDKERGKNLVHKMLLENRLVIKETKLKKLSI